MNSIVEKMCFKDLLEEAESKSPEPYEHLLVESVKSLKEKDEAAYIKMYLKARKDLCNSHFDEPTAELAFMEMKSKDTKNSNKSPFWDKKQTEEIMEKSDIKAGDYNFYDFWFVLNMIRSDFFNPALKETETDYYVEMAKEFLKDDDIKDPKGKAYNYWYHVVKGL